MATQNVRVFEIATSAVTNLNNNEICNETALNATTNFKMWAGKDDDGNVTRWLALDKNAQVADLTATGDVTISSGNITIDALSLSTLIDDRILYGDFSHNSTFKWQNSKLRIGSTVAPSNAVDITVTSEDGIRIESIESAENPPILIFEKTSSSPADNDGLGKTLFKGYDGNASTPTKREFVTLEAKSSDVSAITGEYRITALSDGFPSTFVFGGNELTGNEKFNVWPTGHIQNRDGVRTVSPRYGPAFLSFTFDCADPVHSDGIGSYDHTGGGSGERLFTKTNTNFDFTQEDVDIGNWILLLGPNLGAFLEIKTFVDGDNVLIDGFGLDQDLVSQSFAVYKHPVFISGDGNKTEVSVSSDGIFEIFSYQFTGDNMVGVELNGASDESSALFITANSNGHNLNDALHIQHNTGDLQAGDLSHSLHINLDEVAADSADSTTDIQAIRLETTDVSSAEKCGICLGPGFNNAMRISGATAIDPDYGYEISSGSVVDRVNSGGGGNDAFINNAVDEQVFDSDDDYILIGSDNTFEIITTNLAINGSLDSTLSFFYSKAGGGWTGFSPSDGTNGFTNSGNITFAAPGDWTKDDEAEGDGDITNAYYIKIQRTRNGVYTFPTEDFFKIFTSASTGMAIRGDGSIQLVDSTDAAMVNNSLYFSTDQSNVVWKDNGGVVRDLY